MKTKKKCCKSGPRCKKCPVVWKRLERAGKATREGKRRWVMVDVTKKDLKAARAR